MTILQDQTQTHEQMMAEIARLKAENSKLKDKGSNLKVSAKGAVSLYGLGRWPVTLYPNQWEKVLAMREQIEAFIIDNADRLSFSKDED
jgi:hypothetical protein